MFCLAFIRHSQADSGYNETYSLIRYVRDHMTVDVTETISQTVHPAFQLLRQHHVEALDILVSEYKHKVTGAVHYHLATDYDENVFCCVQNTTYGL